MQEECQKSHQALQATGKILAFTSSERGATRGFQAGRAHCLAYVIQDLCECPVKIKLCAHVHMHTCMGTEKKEAGRPGRGRGNNPDESCQWLHPGKWP